MNYGIQSWHDGRFMHGISDGAHAHFDDINLDARSQWLGSFFVPPSRGGDDSQNPLITNRSITRNLRRFP